MLDAEKIEQIIVALDGGASKASVCRTFRVPRSTLLPHCVYIRFDEILIESDAESEAGTLPEYHGFTFVGDNARIGILPPTDPSAWLRDTSAAEAHVATDGWCLTPLSARMRIAGLLDWSAGATTPRVLMDLVAASTARLRLREDQAISLSVLVIGRAAG